MELKLITQVITKATAVTAVAMATTEAIQDTDMGQGMVQDTVPATVALATDRDMAQVTGRAMDLAMADMVGMVATVTP